MKSTGKLSKNPKTLNMAEAHKLIKKKYMANRFSKTTAKVKTNIC